MSFLHLECIEKMAWITLQRPEKLNALHGTLLKELAATLRDLAQDPQVGVVVLSGAGERAFAAGSDLEELQRLSPSEVSTHVKTFQDVVEQVAQFPKPILAALRGLTLGGGLELALACHLRVAAEDAQLGFPETALGLVPALGGTQRLSRLVGEGLALDMILTGELLSAADALAVGLVTRVFPSLDLRSGTEKLARHLLTRAPLALQEATRLVRQAAEHPLEQGLSQEAYVFEQLMATQDAREGLCAFQEKRRPKFKGN